MVGGRGHPAGGADPPGSAERDARGRAHRPPVGVRHEHLSELARAEESQLVEHTRAEAGTRAHRTDRRQLLVECDAYRARHRHAKVTVPGRTMPLVTIDELVVADPP